jgi:hypothetical protein
MLPSPTVPEHGRGQSLEVRDLTLVVLVAVTPSYDSSEVLKPTELDTP